MKVFTISTYLQDKLAAVERQLWITQKGAPFLVKAGVVFFAIALVAYMLPFLIPFSIFVRYCICFASFGLCGLSMALATHVGDAERLQTTSAILRAGITGEAVLPSMLRYLNNQHVLLNSVPAPAGRGDIDHVLISPNAVYAIEIKHHSGRVVARGTSWLYYPSVVAADDTAAMRNPRSEASHKRTSSAPNRRSSSNAQRRFSGVATGVIGNPPVQVLTAAQSLCGYLASRGIYVPVVPVVVFTNRAAHVEVAERATTPKTGWFSMQGSTAPQPAAHLRAEWGGLTAGEMHVKTQVEAFAHRVTVITAHEVVALLKRPVESLCRVVPTTDALSPISPGAAAPVGWGGVNGFGHIVWANVVDGVEGGSVDGSEGAGGPRGAAATQSVFSISLQHPDAIVKAIQGIPSCLEADLKLRQSLMPADAVRDTKPQATSEGDTKWMKVDYATSLSLSGFSFGDPPAPPTRAGGGRGGRGRSSSGRGGRGPRTRTPGPPPAAAPAPPLPPPPTAAPAPPPAAAVTPKPSSAVVKAPASSAKGQSGSARRRRSRSARRRSKSEGGAVKAESQNINLAPVQVVA